MAEQREGVGAGGPPLGRTGLSAALPGAVPGAVRQAALDAFDSHIAGAVVMDLIYDSLVDGDDRLGGVPGQRRLRFGGVDWGVEVAIEPTCDGRVMTVRVVPPRQLLVRLCCAGGVAVFETLADGTVTMEAFPTGPMSFILPSPGAPGDLLQTAWVRA